MKKTNFLIPLLIMYVCVTFSTVVHAQCDLDSKFVYGVANNGAKYYTDRTYTITDAGAFSGMYMIKTPNNDRHNTTASDYLKYMPAGDGHLYVGYDKRATTPPNWLTSTFTQIPCAKIETSLSSQGWLDVYKTAVSSGECVSMGANKAPGFSGGTVSNFIVLYSTTSVGDQCGGGGGGGGSADVNPGVTSWSQQLPAAERFELVLPTTAYPDGEAVLDHETGLVWEQYPGIAKRAWVDAVVHCLTKQVGGRKGWYLPTVNQLASLVDNTQVNPSLPSGFDSFFFNVQSWWYWTSTTSVFNTDDAWGVFFSDGGMGGNSKANNDIYVWCVRGGQMHDAY